LKGIKINCKTGEIENVEDGLPFPDYLPYQELPKIDLEEVEKLLDYAKSKKWI
jgi:hypothetical protein